MSPEEIEFFKEAEALINPVVQPQIEYRVHYDDTGEIVMCSMIDHPTSTEYLVVDKSVYDTYFMYKVVQGKTVKKTADSGYTVQLQKSNKGFAVVKGHASLLIEPTETYTDIEYYARTH